MSKIKHALSVMCIIYTVIISVMYLIGWALSDTAALFVPTPSKAMLILLFSAVLGFASLLLSRDGTKPIALVAHFVICLAMFVISFVVGGGFSVTGGASIVAVILFFAIYGISMLVRAIVLRTTAKKAVESETYTSIFK